MSRRHPPDFPDSRPDPPPLLLQLSGNLSIQQPGLEQPGDDSPCLGLRAPGGVQERLQDAPHTPPPLLLAIIDVVVDDDGVAVVGDHVVGVAAVHVHVVVGVHHIRGARR